MKRNITRLIYTIIVGIVSLFIKHYNLQLTSIFVGMAVGCILDIGSHIIDDTTITIKKKKINLKK